MQRRKFLIGAGSLAAGAAAATGTGAFTSATINRQSNVANISTDANGIISLQTGMGSDDDVQVSQHQLRIDLSGTGGQGVNLNSIYKIGEGLHHVQHDNLSNHQYAFAVQNNDDVAHTLSYSYTLDNDGWVVGSGGNGSFLMFNPFIHEGGSVGGSFRPGYGTNLRVPASNNHTPQTISKGHFEPGAIVAFQIVVDTTGPDASIGDDLGGTLNFDIGTPSSQS